MIAACDSQLQVAGCASVLLWSTVYNQTPRAKQFWWFLFGPARGQWVWACGVVMLPVCLSTISCCGACCTVDGCVVVWFFSGFGQLFGRVCRITKEHASLQSRALLPGCPLTLCDHASSTGFARPTPQHPPSSLMHSSMYLSSPLLHLPRGCQGKRERERALEGLRERAGAGPAAGRCGVVNMRQAPVCSGSSPLRVAAFVAAGVGCECSFE